jgi:hypothetical protein
VRDRVVVVGTTSPRLGDTHPTPYGGEPMSGPEINANAIATLMAGEPLADAPGWVDALAIIALAALGALAAWPRRAWVTLVAAVLVGIAYLLLAQAAFAGGTVVAIAAAGARPGRRRAWPPPTGSSPGSGRGCAPSSPGSCPRPSWTNWSTAARTSAWAGGASGSVMFADLRSFTASAERLPPRRSSAAQPLPGRDERRHPDHSGTGLVHGRRRHGDLQGARRQADHADRAVAAAQRCAMSACRASTPGARAGRRRAGWASGWRAAR